MKKIFLLNLCAFFLFVFSSCGVSAPQKPVTNFSATMQVNMNNQQVTGEFSNTYQGVMTFSVTSPDTLKGFSYVYKDNKLQLSFENINCDTTCEYLPENNYLNRLYACLHSLGKEENYSCKSSDETETCYTVSAENLNFNIYTNSKTGIINKIEADGIEIVFTKQKAFN